MRSQEIIIWICVLVCIIVAFAIVWAAEQIRRKRGGKEIILDCIANNSDLLVLIYKPRKRRVEFVSDSVSWLFDIEKKQVYQNVGYLFDAISLSREDEIVQNFLSGNVALSDQVEYRMENHLDRHQRWVMVRTAPCGYGRVILTVADVTAEHELLQTLRVLLQEVKEGRESEQMLLSYVGDHIQSRMQQISFAYQEFLEMIQGVVVTDSYSDKDNLNTAFQMRELMQEIADSYENRISDRGQMFELKCQIEHNRVLGDRNKLKKVVRNLLENAIIYTPPGGNISLSVQEEEVVSEEGSQGEAGFIIVVEDTGIGIPEEFIPKLFDPFERADDPRVRKVGGRGLGLVLVTNIVEWMNGSIQVESRVDQGSRFIVNLKFAISDVEQATCQK